MPFICWATHFKWLNDTPYSKTVSIVLMFYDTAAVPLTKQEVNKTCSIWWHVTAPLGPHIWCLSNRLLNRAQLRQRQAERLWGGTLNSSDNSCGSVECCSFETASKRLDTLLLQKERFGSQSPITLIWTLGTSYGESDQFWISKPTGELCLQWCQPEYGHFITFSHRLESSSSTVA